MHLTVVKFICLLSSVFFLSSCATQEGYRRLMQTWIGNSTDSLITAWGPPNSTSDLSTGGKVLQYIRQDVSTSGGYTYFIPKTLNTYGSGGWAQTTYQQPVTVPQSTTVLTCTSRFATDAENSIISFSFQGNACLAKPRE